MSIWDGDENAPNMPLPTMGGHYFWDTIREKNGYKLQQHKITKHFRILNSKNIRKAWGDEGPMQAKFRELTEPSHLLKARYGDIIGVHRSGGLYDHYGVYESENCVYEYGAAGINVPEIRITTLKEFIGSSDGYFILVFPETYGAIGKIHIDQSKLPKRINSHNFFSSDKLIPLTKRIQAKQYKLYSPEETITRAQSRFGERKYNLLLSNCEHFAIWCKTGMRDSHQVDTVLRWIINTRFT